MQAPENDLFSLVVHGVTSSSNLPLTSNEAASEERVLSGNSDVMRDTTRTPPQMLTLDDFAAENSQRLTSSALAL